MNAVAVGEVSSRSVMPFTGCTLPPRRYKYVFRCGLARGKRGGVRNHLKNARRILIPTADHSFVGRGCRSFALSKRGANFAGVDLYPWLMSGLARRLFVYYLWKALDEPLAGKISHEASKGRVGRFDLPIAGGDLRGYFGGGIGIMKLAMFCRAGHDPYSRMKALKLVLVTVSTGWPPDARLSLQGRLCGPTGACDAWRDRFGGYNRGAFRAKLPHRLCGASSHPQHNISHSWILRITFLFLC